MELMEKTELESRLSEMESRLMAKLDAVEQRASGRQTFDRKAAADFLSCSVRKLDYLLSSGEIEHSRLGTGRTSPVVITREALNDYLESSKVMSRHRANMAIRAYK